MGETDIPVIDLAGDRSTVVGALQDAYTTLGFAQVVGHGVDAALIDAVFDATERFHALPLPEKLAVELDHNHRGYIAANTSTDRASELEDVTEPNQSESFMMMREGTPDDPDVVAGVYLAGPNRWPALAGFRETLERYHAAMSDLGRRVVRLLMAGIGAAPPAGAFDPPTTWLRLLHYPARAAAPGVYGSAPHVDFGAITLLAQDDVGGLQVLTPAGAWVDVAPVEGAFVLNTGGVMRRWSNGRILATPHRVLNSAGRSRQSVAFFYDPHMTTVVEPLGAVVSEAEPARDEPAVFADLVRAELEVGYERHGAEPGGSA